MSGSLKSFNVLQDLNSLITKFEDDEESDLWFIDSKHQDLEKIKPLCHTDTSVKSPPNQVIISGSKKHIYNKKFGPTEESTLLKSLLQTESQWMCLKCQFKSREKKVILYHIYSYHHKVILKCTKCPFKTENSKDLILHNDQHKAKSSVQLKGLNQLSINNSIVGKLHDSEAELVTDPVYPSPLTKNHRIDFIDQGNTENAKCNSNTTKPISSVATGQKKYLYQCKRCSVVFSYKSSLQQHMQEFHQVKSVVSKFNCSHCKFYSFKQEDVKIHFYQVHLRKSERTVVKPQFPTQYPKIISQFSSQSKVPILPVKKKFICLICKTEFNTELDMKTHLIMKEGFSHQCSDCKSLFRTKTNLSDHFQRCKKKSIAGTQLNSKLLIKTSEVIEKETQKISDANKLSLTETCSSLLDILGIIDEDSED